MLRETECEGFLCHWKIQSLTSQAYFFHNGVKQCSSQKFVTLYPLTGLFDLATGNMLIGNVLGLCIWRVWSLYFHSLFRYPWMDKFCWCWSLFRGNFWSQFLCTVGSEADFSSSSSIGTYKTHETLPSNSAGKISSSRRYGFYALFFCFWSLIRDGWYFVYFSLSDLIFHARWLTILNVK